MMQSYPIHPEVFAQLYEEWTTIEDSSAPAVY